MSMILNKARKFREYIESMSVNLDDEQALEIIDVFPAWRDDAHYAADDRVRYGGVLYKCLQAHDAQAAWTPEAAPSLWAQVLIPDPGDIPEWVQPDSTNPYMTGDKVRHNGHVWRSLVDNNVWEPSESLPTLWEMLE